MILGKPAPFACAFVDAVDDAIREQHPSHAMSATQRAWLAFCETRSKVSEYQVSVGSNFYYSMIKFFVLDVLPS